MAVEGISNITIETHCHHLNFWAYCSSSTCRHLDKNGDGRLSRQEVQEAIAALQPGSTEHGSAAAEVVGLVSAGSDSIDFDGFLAFFSMVCTPRCVMSVTITAVVSVMITIVGVVSTVVFRCIIVELVIVVVITAISNLSSVHSIF